MTARQDIDRQVASWLEAERPQVAPDGLLEAVQARVNRTGRRRGWLVADRWTWRHRAAIRTTVRAALLVAVVASLVAILIVVAGLIGSPRPAPPYGLTTAGLIAVDTKDGIVLTSADGSGRVLLLGGDGKNVSPTWSRDGLRLAFWHRTNADSGPWSLVVVDADGSHRAVLTEGINLKVREETLNQPSNLAWSPDSRRLAFAADVDSGSSIFVASLGRSGAIQITDPKLQALDPAWSPSGNVIAFESDASRTLHVVAPDGAGERRLSTLSETTLWPDWAPDGSRLAITAGSGDATDIFVVSADGIEVVNISSDPSFEISPSWSPDGKHLAWARAPADESARSYVVVAELDLSRIIEIRVPADLAPPVWAPDGSRIYSYGLGPTGEFAELIVLDPSGVAPVVRIPAEGNIGNGNWQRLP